jgi:hypothetical protein
LAFFVLPVATNPRWRRNLDELKARIDLFNGRRRIGVATGNVSRSVVFDYVRGRGFECLTVTNTRSYARLRLGSRCPGRSSPPARMRLFAGCTARA